jgi:putative membrane protein
MSPIRTRWAVAAATVAVAATPGAAAFASDGQSHSRHVASAPAQAPPAVDAQTFVTAATQSNTFEIVASRVARRRSDDDDVRAIARHLIADHTAAGRQLAQVAGTLGLQVPAPSLNAKQQAVVERLRSVRRRAFDRAWLRAQRAAHEEAIALFVGTGSNEANPEALRDLTVATLPILGRHLGEVTFALQHRD